MTDRRVARLWFLRGLYVGQVSGAVIAGRPFIYPKMSDLRWMLKLWRDVGRPNLTVDRDPG